MAKARIDFGFSVPKILFDCRSSADRARCERYEPPNSRRSLTRASNSSTTRTAGSRPTWRCRHGLVRCRCSASRLAFVGDDSLRLGPMGDRLLTMPPFFQTVALDDASMDDAWFGNPSRRGSIASRVCGRPNGMTS